MLKHLLVDCSSWVGQARVYVTFSVLNLILAFPRAFRKQYVFRAYNCEEPLAAVQRRTLTADVVFAGRDHYIYNSFVLLGFRIALTVKASFWACCSSCVITDSHSPIRYCFTCLLYGERGRSFRFKLLF